MRTKKIDFKYPVSVDGVEYKEMTMRSAKARDQVFAAKSATHSADIEVMLFANLCEVPPSAVEELEMADYKQLQEAYNGFLS